MPQRQEIRVKKLKLFVKLIKKVLGEQAEGRYLQYLCTLLSHVK